MKSRLTPYSDFFKHPLFLLIIGSIISSFLFPKILSEASKQESDRKQKTSLAFKFLSKNAEMNQDYNSLLTSLELFHKYSSEKYLDDEQKQLRVYSKEIYMEFNKDVWWWHWNLYEEAKVWKLLPSKDDSYVKDALNAYSKSWEKTIYSLPPFWEACVNSDYRIRDSSITTLLNISRREFENSQLERDAKIRAVVSRFDVESY